MDSKKLESLARLLSRQIRDNFQNHTHPKYGLQLIYAAWQAKLCGYDKITALEFGVASGRGLSALENYARDFSEKFQIDIEVKGFDTGHGLPAPKDFRDHPEIWKTGDYQSPTRRSNVVYGDVKDSLIDVIQNWSSGKIGFVSLDLDLYHSTKNALKIFEMSPDFYLPAVMIHLDDAHTQLTMNPWCGAELALGEFNQTHQHRKFEQKHHCWRIDNFYVLHVLDHPMRNGTHSPASAINCCPL